jgi:TolB-like protein/Tfp pilus assembly protein PilF
MAEFDESEKTDSSVTSATAPASAASAVFISYASKDVAVAEALCKALEGAGIACWIAPRDVIPGEFYADAIVQAINACQFLVLVLSESSSTSPHVVREVERASAKKRPVISFRIDLTPLPPGLEYFLSASHWLDASTGGAERAFPKLIEAVRGRTASASGGELEIRGAVADSSKHYPQGAITKPAADPDPNRSAEKHTRQRLTRPTIALIIAVVVGGALAYLIINRFWPSKGTAQQEPTPTASVAPANATASTAISDKSIAVLPFVDMSEKKDQEYFSDGLAEELIGLLTKIPALHVPARTSSFYFKGKQSTIAEIAKALSVAHVLEGSVRKSGNTLRITAQLIRVDNGYDIWSETYDRQLDDIFKVQDEIAGAVVKALKVALLDGVPQRAAPTTNSEAYTLYLKARELHTRASEADEDKAIEELQQALKLDPKFALAWALLADVRCTSYGYFTRPYEQTRKDALYAAAQAVQVDPDLAEAHLATARVQLLFDWDWVATDIETKKALSLDPANAQAIFESAFLASFEGRYDEALHLADTGVARDPLDARGYQVISHASYRLGKFTQAESALRRQIALYPNAPAAHYRLGVVLLAEHEPAAALEAMRSEPDAGYRKVGLPLALDALGQKSEADAAIAELEKEKSVSWSYQMALIYAHRRDTERAFAWLETAFRSRDSGLLSIKGEPLLAPLESDPRYQALLRKMKFPV